MEEHEYHTEIFGLSVGVNKVGGGTVGDVYWCEEWEVTVMNGPEYVLDREILYIGADGTHWKAADLAAEFASERIGK